MRTYPLIGRSSHAPTGRQRTRMLIRSGVQTLVIPPVKNSEPKNVCVASLYVPLIEDLQDNDVRLHRLLAAFVRSVAPYPDDDQTRTAQTLADEVEQCDKAGNLFGAVIYRDHLRHALNSAGAGDDAGVASVLNALAEVLWVQGSYREARPLYERALAIYQRRLGPNHPTTARVRASLVAAQRHQRSALSAGVVRRVYRSLRRRWFRGQMTDGLAKRSLKSAARGISASWFGGVVWHAVLWLAYRSDLAGAGSGGRRIPYPTRRSTRGTTLPLCRVLDTARYVLHHAARDKRAVSTSRIGGIDG
jgi:Tetratricopeptide repeat